jgi:hypothetical protein
MGEALPPRRQDAHDRTAVMANRVRQYFRRKLSKGPERSPSLAARLPPDKRGPLTISSMRTILTLRTLGTLLCLLFFCSCASLDYSIEDSLHPQLPADVTMNTDTGCGHDLYVPLRLESGEELLFVVDTGCPVTILDKSLEPKLGERHTTGDFSCWGEKQKASAYAAPKLYLGCTPLATANYVFTVDFKDFQSHSGWPVMGILGMDCLRHYCIQLDFEARKMRFLDDDHLDVSTLGKAFPLTFSGAGQGIRNCVLPFIHHGSLI